MVKWEYYVKYFPTGGGVEDPETVLRKRHDDVDSDAQGLHKDGEWRQSWTLLDISFGKGFAEAEPVTRERAAAWARKWHADGGLAKIPIDLE